MKIKCLCLLAILGTAYLQAFPQEYDSLVLENAQWKVMYDDDNTPWEDEMGGWLLRGDTIINDIQYIKLYSRAFEEPQSNVIISQNLFGYLREDVANKIVYALEIFPGNLGCDSLNEEYVLFDFSIEVGDTSQMCIHTEQLGYTVLSEIQNYWTFGKNRNVYLFNGACVELIEGVGHYQGLMESPVINISGGVIYSLFDYCVGTDEECNVIYVKVDEKTGRDYFSIYPNPADHIVQIQLSNIDCGDLNIIMSDVYGRNLLKMNNVIEEVNINIDFFPDGLYFVSILERNTVIATKKFIVKK